MIAQGLGSIAKSASAHGLELVEGTCSKRILNEMNISLSRAKHLDESCVLGFIARYVDVYVAIRLCR